MSTRSIGWLPYGSDHASVLYSADCKTAASITSIPATTVAELGTGTQVFDATKGMKVGAAGGYKVTGLTNHNDCNTGGWQFRFEVERDWVCFDGEGSTGYDPAATEELGLIYGAGGPNICKKLTNQQLQTTMSGTSLDAEWKEHGAVNNALNWNPTYHSAGKGDFVTVNVGMIGNQKGGVIFMAVDGLILKAAETNYTAAPVDFFSVFDIGSASGGGIKNHYIRNVQLSSEPPSFPVIPKLACMAMIGDSFNAYGTGGEDGTLIHKLRRFPDQYAINNAFFDAVSIYGIKRELAKNSLFVGDDYMRPDYGSRIDGVIDSAAIPEILTKKPNGIIYSAGTNDAAAGRTAAQVSSDLQTQFATLFAGGIDWLIMPNVPSLQNDQTNYSAEIYADRVDVVNEGIADAISTYAAANPTHRIKTADVFGLFGGRNFNPDYFHTNDIHPSPLGHTIRSTLIAKSIIAAIA